MWYVKQILNKVDNEHIRVGLIINYLLIISNTWTVIFVTVYNYNDYLPAAIFM